MTLKCTNCGSYGLEITGQSYTDDTAFESYECESCGGTGTLNHEHNRTHLSGCVGRD